PLAHEYRDREAARLPGFIPVLEVAQPFRRVARRAGGPAIRIGVDGDQVPHRLHCGVTELVHAGARVDGMNLREDAVGRARSGAGGDAESNEVAVLLLCHHLKETVELADRRARIGRAGHVSDFGTGRACLLHPAAVVRLPPGAVLDLGITIEDVAGTYKPRVGQHQFVQGGEVARREFWVAVVGDFVPAGPAAVAMSKVATVEAPQPEPDMLTYVVDLFGPGRHHWRVLQRRVDSDVGDGHARRQIHRLRIVAGEA